MKRTVLYRQGYKIIISDKFYEVISGNRVLHFGELRHRHTVQEVWNKTIELQEEEDAIDKESKSLKVIRLTVCSGIAILLILYT